MKLIVVITLLVNAAMSAPRHDDNVQIIRYNNDNDGLGSYSFELEQSDGIKREEKGELKNEGLENEAIAVVGKYSWIAPDGTTYIVTYTADENGFHPTIEEIKSGKPIAPMVPIGAAAPPAVIASLLG